MAHAAVFTLAGYQQQTVPVETGIQGVTWVDILFWPGFIVDFASGNAYKVSSPDLTANLTPIVVTTTPAVQTVPSTAVVTVQPAPASIPVQIAPIPVQAAPVPIPEAMPKTIVE